MLEVKEEPSCTKFAYALNGFRLTMCPMLNTIQLFFGVLLLALGGEALIRGSLSAAKRLGISPLLSGLVIVGFGTSAPELVVSVDAVWNNRLDIAVGNIVGSNIGNIFLILGICALIAPLAVKPLVLRRDVIAVLLANVLFIVLAMNGEIGPAAGIILLATLLAYLGGTYWSEKQQIAPSSELHIAESEELTTLPRSTIWTAVLVISGLLLLIIGSQVLLIGAVGIATHFEISEAIIGLTLVAVGTSLPELSISVFATLRRHADVAVGNVLGSNIFNLLGILGISALVQPLQVSPRILIFDQWVMLAATVMLFLFLISGRQLSRREGGMFLAAYATYVYFGLTSFNY